MPHWETGDRARHPRQRAGHQDQRRDVHDAARRSGATLARALCQFALDSNADAFEEIRPPSLVTTATLTATGQLPKFADDAYAIERDDLWCIPTAEVPLTSLYAGEVLDEDAAAGADDGLHAVLPPRGRLGRARHARHAALARVRQGRDPRRRHARAGAGAAARAASAAPRQLIAALELPYRIIEICTGDMGQSHHRSFDIEVYAPGCDAWLEVSSISWFSDYQARRADIRFRAAGEKGTSIAHTLNGSALAVPRVWAAIVENYRQPDGSVADPGGAAPVHARRRRSSRRR